MNICIIGTGFVGVVSSAVFASFGNTVVGLDIDQAKIDKLKQGIVPFYEPGLTDLLLEQQQKGHLQFTTDYKAAISEADVIMIAVGTPSAPDGQADLTYVLASAQSLAPFLKEGAIVAIKSTVPPGTLAKVGEKITPLTKVKFFTASLPEFLKEGSAVQDTLHPDRVVIGASENQVFETLEKLHQPLNAPIVRVSPESAQMAKYAANAYLATRITFINQIADLCEKNQADIQDVIQAIGYDKRIGSHYWYPGFGYGGSCFPKDVKELAAYSRAVGEANNLLNKVNEINDQRVWNLLDKYGQTLGGWENKKVAVLGLSFKPNTDDTREAPSTRVIPYLVTHGAQVTGYDPQVKWSSNFEYRMPGSTATLNQTSFTQLPSIQEATQDAEVIIVLIEWKEITAYDFSTVRKANTPQWFIDARNQFSPATMKELGFTYIGVGRS
jgi:UDPglucose 6-dehydrogenase